MKNILYLDDWINLYNKKLNKIIVFKPYKNTLKSGIIIDRDKFIKVFNRMLEKNKLKISLFQENIIVIINDIYTKENKRVIKEVLNELNYNKIIFINEKNILKMNNSNIYVNYNENYCLISYKENNKRICESYNNNKINRKIIINFLNENKKTNIYIYGKNARELFLNIKINKRCYIYKDYENLLLTLLIYKNVKEK